MFYFVVRARAHVFEYIKKEFEAFLGPKDLSVHIWSMVTAYLSDQ